MASALQCQLHTFTPLPARDCTIKEPRLAMCRSSTGAASSRHTALEYYPERVAVAVQALQRLRPSRRFVAHTDQLIGLKQVGPDAADIYCTCGRSLVMGYSASRVVARAPPETGSVYVVRAPFGYHTSLGPNELQ
jgi:hypothetical protein